MQHSEEKTLAQFVIQKREQLGLSRSALALNSGLDIDAIIAIEQGIDLFLPTTVRQKLAKGLKVENKTIKALEKRVEYSTTPSHIMDAIREEILLNSTNPEHTIYCPQCGSKLITRIAKLYDLKDNLILRPKARCSKCPFQLTD